MRFDKTFLVILSMVIALCGCSIKNSIVKKPMNTPVIMVSSVNPNISTARLKTVIIEACTRHGWAINSSTDSNIEATLNHNGKETVTVDIPFSREQVEIKYKGSTNMRYDGSNIHRSYNRWVKNLEVNIRNGIALAR